MKCDRKAAPSPIICCAGRNVGSRCADSFSVFIRRLQDEDLLSSARRMSLVGAIVFAWRRGDEMYRDVWANSTSTF